MRARVLRATALALVLTLASACGDETAPPDAAPTGSATPTVEATPTPPDDRPRPRDGADRSALR